MSSIRLTTSHTSLASACTNTSGGSGREDLPQRTTLTVSYHLRQQLNVYGVDHRKKHSVSCPWRAWGLLCPEFGTQRSKKNKPKTCFSVLVSELDPQRIHGSKNGRQALDGVAVDHGLILLHIIPRETVLVDNPARPRTHRKDVRE